MYNKAMTHLWIIKDSKTSMKVITQMAFLQIKSELKKNIKNP